MSASRRRQLSSQGNRLKAAISVSTDVTEGTLNHVRVALEKHELLKVRFATDDRDECRAAAEAIAAGVPCELVQVVGRVALFHRAADDSPGDVPGGGVDEE